jgi:cyclopropane fatty-acyl-phospholipid synthase-like methyltransferase
MLERHALGPRTVCEIGCGAGEILSLLQKRLDPETRFVGYEISPQAFELCKERANERLRFELGDVLSESHAAFDLVLMIDLIEHLEDYFDFLRRVRTKGKYKLLHVPLELSAQSVLRQTPILANRASVGHLHYFTKDLVLEVLHDVGYEVIDWFYTLSSVEEPPKSWRQRVARLPRRLAFATRPDFGVRLLGGASLLVLAR